MGGLKTLNFRMFIIAIYFHDISFRFLSQTDLSPPQMDQYGSIGPFVLSIDPLRFAIDPYWSVMDLYWSVLIGIDQHWSYWSALINRHYIDQLILLVLLISLILLICQALLNVNDRSISCPLIMLICHVLGHTQLSARIWLVLHARMQY